MFVTLWEFEVKPGCEDLFEREYGPTGEWVQLFRRDDRYLGTRLLRQLGREQVYVTMDEWDSREAYEEFRGKYAAEYTQIDLKCQALTTTEKLIGEWWAGSKT